MVVNQVIFLQRIGGLSRGGGPGSAVVVSPISAGPPWFTVSSDGTGVLQAWTTGSSSSGGDSGPGGSVGSIEVGNVGIVDGIKVNHTVQLNLTKDTKVLVGSQPYGKGRSASVADALLNSGNGPGDDALSDRLLTIKFHRVGQSMIADVITAPLEAGNNPLQY